MEQWQRADHHIGFAKHQPRAQPAVVNHPRRFVLCDFWHARGAAGMEISRDVVCGAVGKRQPVARMFGTFGVEILDIGIVRNRVFGPDQRHDPTFGRRQIPHQINL